MEKVCIGKLITTHGIKGEVRIRSDFEYKNRVFVIGNTLSINNTNYVINSYRMHKGYDMVTFKGVNDINEVIPLKQKDVFIDKDELKLTNDEYLYNDLINMDIEFNNEIISKVKDYNRGSNDLIIFRLNNKNVYIPIVDRYIKKVDVTNNKVILTDNAKELL